MTQNLPAWWRTELENGELHAQILGYVSTVEQAQFDLFNKFVRLEAMYDPNSTGQRGVIAAPGPLTLSNVVENVVASNVDTVTAIVAATQIRARFMTDDAEWSVQRRAKHLEWYSDALSAKYDVDQKCVRAFRAAALKGTGVLKIFTDEDNEPCVQLVPIDDIVVDEMEARSGAPKQIHQRMICDRDELAAQFPEYETEIERANLSTKLWAGYRPVNSNECVAIESWRLPIGKRGSKRYMPGRHAITIDGCDLLDEEWHDTEFPFVFIFWSEREQGWYGIGLAERIAGIQNALNRRNWQINRLLDQGAAPTTYVGMMDAHLAVQTATSNRATVVPHKGPIPTTVAPPIVNAEVYNSRNDLKNSSYEESGVSRMTAQAMKPAGIDSGVAMREYRDATTQRFALQEKAFERLKLDVIRRLIAVCKELGDSAPVLVKQSRFGRRMLEWKDVDLGEVKVQIVAASSLSKTPAGRTQTVLEWAQAGIISQDQARALLDHPDLEREMSLMEAALETVEWAIEEILDGNQVVPEPYMNLDMCIVKAQQQYLLVMTAPKVPEDILESLRTFIAQAAYKPPAPANANAMAGAPDMGAAPPGPMPDQGAMPPLQPPLQQMPANTPAVAAFAPQAMQLRSA